MFRRVACVGNFAKVKGGCLAAILNTEVELADSTFIRNWVRTCRRWMGTAHAHLHTRTRTRIHSLPRFLPILLAYSSSIPSPCRRTTQRLVVVLALCMQT